MKNFAAFLFCLSLITAALKADEPIAEPTLETALQEHITAHVEAAETKENNDTKQEYTEQDIRELCQECQKGNNEACWNLHTSMLDKINLQELALFCNNNPQAFQAHYVFHKLVKEISLRNGYVTTKRNLES
jgi:hypothetical protein